MKLWQLMIMYAVLYVVGTIISIAGILLVIWLIVKVIKAAW
jgi:hypothetical protein